MRGTFDAYNKLAQKDDDTLYFISNADDDDGVLYLGSKLIAGGDGSISLSSIGDLADVLLNELQDKQILIYDATQAKWINSTVENLVGNFVGATSASAGIAGLVPAPMLGQTNLFLRSDGTWAEIEAGSGTGASLNIITIQNDSDKSHTNIITEATAGLTPSNGDIIIIKDLVSPNIYQHTAYVYNGTNWAAMDGNYNAENVYFDEDFIFTEDIGSVIIPENGSIKVPAAGKNIKEFLVSIFAQETNPLVTDPSMKVTLSSNNVTYEVGTLYSPGYAVEFNPGSYEFGPETGITVSSWHVEDSEGNVSDSSAGTFNDITVGDETEYFITATVNYNDGAIPLTNLGNDYINGQIKSGSLTGTTKILTGFRNTFFGAVTEKVEELTSADIRALSTSGKALTNGDAFSVNAPAGSMRVIVAYPSSLQDITSMRDVNALNTQVKSSLKSYLVEVEGANGYDAIEYKVYILDFAVPRTSANVYNVII